MVIRFCSLRRTDLGCMENRDSMDQCRLEMLDDVALVKSGHARCSRNAPAHHRLLGHKAGGVQVGSRTCSTV